MINIKSASTFNTPQRLALALLSALLIGLAYHFPAVVALTWVAFIPLLLALQDVKPLRAIYLGLAAGVGAGLFIQAWIVPSANVFMGQSVVLSVMTLVAATTLFALPFVLFAFIYARLGIYSKKISLLNILLVPAIWAALAYLNALSASTFPWFALNLGNFLFNLPELIQLATVIGVFGFSFLIVGVNYLFFLAIKTKNFDYFYIGTLIIITQYLVGLFIME
ncbi:MAG: hypothetical protein M0Q90_10550 [Bacteroidales bacterium]|nr:hypothetical protein [Bacteroidales bacterium]